MLKELLSKAKNKINEINAAAEAKRQAEEERYANLANGDLPEVIPSNLVLKREEYCHYAEPIKRIVTTTRTTYKTQSAGVSFRIAKGVSVGSRKSYSEPIKTQNSTEYPGTLFITNKRIVFLAREKGADIPFGKITGVQMYKNGVELFVGAKNYMFRLNNVREFAAIMSGIGKKYQIE